MVTAKDLEGVWLLDGEDHVAGDGSVHSSSVHDRFGKLVYAPGGHLSVVVGPLERPKPFEPSPRMDLNGVAADERAEVARDCVIYAGRYSVADGIASHHIEFSLNPNRAGTSTTRVIGLEDDALTLTTAKSDDGSYQRIRWRRVERFGR